MPTVEGRIVETAVRNVIEPIFEHVFAEHSYGFRPGRGAKDALRRLDQLLNAGKVWVIDADLQAYLDTIPQEKLSKLLEEHIADGALLELINKMLQPGVMESGKGWLRPRLWKTRLRRQAEQVDILRGRSTFFRVSSSIGASRPREVGLRLSDSHTSAAAIFDL